MNNYQKELSGYMFTSSDRSSKNSLAKTAMKSLARWGVTLSLASTALVGSAFVGVQQALALPEEQVIQKLQQVPVFTLTNAQGAPLVASVPNPNGQNNNANASVTGVFISQQDAESFLQKLRTQNPEIGNTVKVTPVPLAEIYRMAEANRNQPEQLIFDLVPVQRQVDSALALLRQDGQQVQQFPGVPLFYASGGQDKGFLTIQRGNQQVIPFFFNKEDLQTVLDRYKQQQPNQQIQNIEIEVANLQQVIKTMKESNDQQLNQIVLIPAKDTLEYLRSLQPAGQAQPR